MPTPWFSRAVCALALLCPLALPRAARAEPITLGVEAEMNAHGVELTKAVKLAVDGTHYVYKSTGAEVGDRLVCTKGPSVIDGTYPLVSFTYDLSWKVFARRIYTLEVVTGPVVHDAAKEWNEMTARMGEFYSVIARACTEGKAETVAVGSQQFCAVSAATLVSKLPWMSTSCNPDHSTDLPEKELGAVFFLVRADAPKGVLAAITTGIAEANVQMSAAFHLARFGDPALDLRGLYDDPQRPLDASDDGGPTTSLSQQAYAYFRTQKLPRLSDLSLEQRGFLTQYFVSLYAFTAYFGEQHRHTSGEVPYGSWVAAHKITVDDWELKQAWAALAKEPLDQTFQLLAKRDASFAPPRFSPDGKNEDFFCDEKFVASIKMGAADALEVDTSQLLSRCRASYKWWEASIVGGHDPLGLATLAHVVKSRIADDAIRAVFEMRKANAFVRQRHMTAVASDEGVVTVMWNEPTITLPSGLGGPKSDEDDE